MPATLLDIVDKTYSKKHALLHFVYLCIRCTGLKKTFFFGFSLKNCKNTQKWRPKGKWTGSRKGPQFDYIMERRHQSSNLS